MNIFIVSNNNENIKAFNCIANFNSHVNIHVVNKYKSINDSYIFIIYNANDINYYNYLRNEISNYDNTSNKITIVCIEYSDDIKHTDIKNIDRYNKYDFFNIPYGYKSLNKFLISISNF